MGMRSERWDETRRDVLESLFRAWTGMAYDCED
jgi:hypothetical protein